MMSRTIRFNVILCLLILGTSSLVLAGLGEDSGSVTLDARTMGGTTRVTRHSHYTLHEISQNWVHVREFAGTDGKVFALAWNGKRHPDLKQILGDRYEDFQKAVGKARATHRHSGSFSTTVNNLHVELGGHMGATFGRVWRTDQIPSGMDLHEIK